MAAPGRWVSCLLLMLTLWCEVARVGAIEPEAMEELSEHYRRMMQDWYNVTRYPRVPCTPDELEFLRSCSSVHDDDDDYYELNPKFGPKATRPDGGCERLEIRQATRAQWLAYVNALTQMYNTLINSRSQYQIFAAMHRSTDAPSAHFCPAFLSWHRVYLKTFEEALRRFDPTVCLIYIDWRFEAEMTDPCQSVIFTSDYFGIEWGALNGNFAAWRGYSPGCQGSVFRQCVGGSRGRSYLFTDSTLSSYTRAYRTYPDWCYPQNQAFESAHGGPHVMIGGTMNSIPCAVNDPIFWSHHACMDFYWNIVRGSEINRQFNYPTNWNLPSEQQANAPMRPFSDSNPQIRNTYGLLDTYDQTVSYGSIRGRTCTSDFNCNADGPRGPACCYQGRCYSRVRIGAPCVATAFCYYESRCAAAPTCTGGVCRC